MADRRPGTQAAEAGGLEDAIEVGFHVFTTDGGEEVGAVRAIMPHSVVIYVENAGDFEIPLAAVSAVHSQKVILDCARLDAALRTAIGRAHDDEVPGL